MALKYNKAQSKTIETAWNALLRAVEHTILQERRLTESRRLLRKHFGSVASRSHIIGYVVHGLKPEGPKTLVNLAHASDENLLCYMVGVYLRDHDKYTAELRDLLAAATAAESAACEESLKNL